MPYFSEFVEALEHSHVLFQTYPILADVVARDFIRVAIALEGCNRQENPPLRQQNFMAKTMTHAREVCKALGYQAEFQDRTAAFPLVLKMGRTHVTVPLSVQHERRF